MTNDPDAGRVLWVTDEVPGRDLGGGNMRLASLFEALAASIPTDLWVVGELEDDRVRAAAADVVELPKRHALWSTNPMLRRALQLGLLVGSRHPAEMHFTGPGRRSLARALRRGHGRYGLVVVEHEALAPLLPSRRCVPWIIDLQHLLSVMADQQAQMADRSRHKWLLAADRRKARALERRILRSFDRLLVCSEKDAAALRELGGDPDQRVVVIPNGVDLSRFRVTPLPAQPRILFPGTLSYLPNVDGARWFCTEVLPRLRSKVPEADVRLVGRAPVPEVLELARLPGVSVHADVPSMVPYFESARVTVVPLRVGTGTRLKALEAMAAARPVVGTTVGLEGIGIIDGEHARVVDEAAPMAAAIAELLVDDGASGRLAKAGREHVERHYGWEAIGARMVAAVTDLLNRSNRS